ncbi:MAG: spore coat biosynthesis protein F, partial [Pacificimonas sp.]
MSAGAAPTIGSVLILAGRRDGVVDPFAAAHGVEDKCLIPVAGVPMLSYILAAMARLPERPPILLCSNDPEGLRAVPEIAPLERDERLHFVPALTGIADSVLNAARDATYP